MVVVVGPIVVRDPANVETSEALFAALKAVRDAALAEGPCHTRPYPHSHPHLTTFRLFYLPIYIYCPSPAQI